jgi:predicted acyltransferase
MRTPNTKLAIRGRPASLCAVMADSRATAPRLRSLDALRGFDMLWIIGLSEFFIQLAGVTKIGWLETWAVQMDHVAWEGIRVHDLIFPLFMFASGISVPYALKPKLETGTPRGKLLAGIWRRVLVLVLLGLVYNGGLRFAGFSDQRFASVLGQIGIAYGVAVTVFLLTRTWRGRSAWCLGIMVAVTVLQLLIPVPGHGAGVLTPEGSINAWLDQHFLPGRRHEWAPYDPEGVLSVISACALTLGGVLLGGHVRSWEKPSLTAATRLLIAGTALLFVGWVCWHLGYPPIKKIWTTTFNLLAGGICTWLFVVFHLAVDFRPHSNWSFFLQVIGMNSITIYLAEKIVPFHLISEFFFGGVAAHSGNWSQVILTLGVLIIEWLVLYYLWRKNTFLRV